jgi:hypothetical protein
MVSTKSYLKTSSQKKQLTNKRSNEYNRIYIKIKSNKSNFVK